MDKLEKNRFLIALIFPAVFVGIIGLIHLSAYSLDVSLVSYGVFPRKLSGLIGILTSPLIHADFKHLFNNSVPLIIMGTALFYFYKEVAFKVSFWIYLMVGVWTWVSAREAYHIGASGVLYGLFSFLLVSGFLRRNKNLISLSFAVIFLYGSLVWGIFPIDVKISFEGHLWGVVAGIVLALYYRKQGPQKIEHIWPDEEEEDDDENAYWKMENQEDTPIPNQKVNYIFKPSKSKKED